MRPLPLLVVLALLAGALGLSLATPAGATASLQVDAGTTQVSYDNATLALKGQARGGVAPYAYAWTGAAASRFSDPAAAAPHFNASGLALGNHTLTLTVTDATSTTVSDTVVVRVDRTTNLLTANGNAIAAVPDEEAGVSIESTRRDFTVPARTGHFVARLSFVDGTPQADLDLKLWSPYGPYPHEPAGREGTNPEQVTMVDPFAGVWRSYVEPKVATATRYTLTVQAASVALLPDAHAGGSYEFGGLAPQVLTGTASGGVAPYAYEWDADGDGWFESTGATMTATLPAGTHVATLRVTDATGLSEESRATVVVRAGDHVRRVGCGADPSVLWNMEMTASKGSCWLHGGHHTYYMQGLYAFRGVRGYAYAVEQEMAPSDGAANVSDPLAAPVAIEISRDGQAWTEVTAARYPYGEIRQYVFFDGVGSGQEFRFLRIRAPDSLAHGLSGYVDASELRIEMDDVAAPPAPPAVNGTRLLDCRAGDVMEDFFAEHPCWFGGIDRYDSPSFFHTYPVGDQSQVTRIRGNFTLGPWRTDDFMFGGPLLFLTTGPSRNVTSLAYVQVSADGVNWTTVATVLAPYGVPTGFDVSFNATAASFVRLFPEYHANYDRIAQQPSHHHPRAYFLDSRVAVDGTFQDWP